MEKMYLKSFAELFTEELLRIVAAREEVFFLEQHVTEIDVDDNDLLATHIWVEDEGKVLAYVRVIPAGVHYSEASFGRLLVRKEHRHHGLGDRMVRAAVDCIFNRWDENAIRISAQSYLIPYYESVGFRLVSEPYIEAGIEHCAMVLEKSR